MTSPQPQHLLVRQKLTFGVNRYYVYLSDAAGAELQLLAFAQQKRLAFKEEVTFYAEEERTTPVFSFKARKRLDLGSGYDVTAADGSPLGEFKKDFAKSLLNSTWYLTPPGGTTLTGSERSPLIAFLRRFWELIPFVGDIPIPFVFHFDFFAPDGALALSSSKNWGLRDVYRVELGTDPNGHRLDWRLAAAMAVGLDALQSR
ncbi:MAG: hypothetical protein J7513_10395 [Solirubrobacteraceae bacterium]|nr:hypothetical protein [Solirubrobacteraceae bacterium]